jgi:hypothetical protein
MGQTTAKAVELYRTSGYGLTWEWVKAVALPFMEHERVKMSAGSSESGERLREGVTLRQFLATWKIKWDKDDNL